MVVPGTKNPVAVAELSTCTRPQPAIFKSRSDFVRGWVGGLVVWRSRARANDRREANLSRCPLFPRKRTWARAHLQRARPSLRHQLCQVPLVDELSVGPHQMYLAAIAISPATTMTNTAVCSQKLLAKLVLLAFWKFTAVTSLLARCSAKLSNPIWSKKCYVLRSI